MKIEDLIDKIYKSGAKSINVKRQTVKHGNRDQSGDYSIVTLDIDGKKIDFANESGSWVKK